MPGAEVVGETAMDLGSTGVVWLDGVAVPVLLTGSGRAVARLIEAPGLTIARMPGSAGTPEVQLAFGEGAAAPLEEPRRSTRSPVPAAAAANHPSSRILRVGGRRRKDATGAVERWYRREARERIEAVTAAEATRLELEPGKITIRDQKTRWGSCSTSGTLSFNWRLAIGPGHALRYVVVHELIHIRHHNHSRAFWNALAEAMPDWKRSADWLRANERLLTAYRPRI